MKIQILTGPDGQLIGVLQGPMLSRHTREQAAGLVVAEDHTLREVEVEDDLLDCDATELHRRINDAFQHGDERQEE